MPDGIHDLVTGVVRAFHSAGVTRDEVERFRDIAMAVQSGDASREQAEQQIAQLDRAFLTVWQWLNANGTAIQTIIAIIVLFLMFYFQKLSDADAQKLQRETEKQTEATQSVERVERQILAELRKQNVPVPSPKALPKPKAPKQQTTLRQTQVRATSPNRRERRAQIAKDRRGPRD